MLAKTVGTTLALFSLACGSVAVAQTAAPAAVAAAPERAGASVDDAGQLQGTTMWIVGAIALGLIIWGAIELFGDNEEDFPVSP